MEPKTLVHSKTFWMNLIVAASALLASSDVIAIIPPSGLKYVVALQAVMNVVLRLLSSGVVTVTA